MARRATTKKATKKSAKKKATRKGATKAVAKKGTRKAPAKKRTRDPVGKATAAHLVAEKKLAVAKKAYDRAVIAEARAADKLKAVIEKIAKKAAKEQSAKADTPAEGA